MTTKPIAFEPPGTSSSIPNDIPSAPSVNPIRRLREMETISITEFLEATGLTKAALLRTEQGTYNTIPPKILDFWTERGYDPANIKEGYKKFVSSTRIASYGALTTELPPSYSPVVSGHKLDWLPVDVLLENHKNSYESVIRHPFVQWRLFSGITKQLDICRLFCVHPAHLSAYELKANYAGTPQQLMLALKESGYSTKVLGDLEVRYLVYRRWLADQRIGRKAS